MTRAKGRRLVAAALLLVVAAMASRTAWLVACGPFLIEIETVASMRPAHVESYRKGDLGVVRPFFPRRYLVQAYRVFSDRRPLTNVLPSLPSEQAGTQGPPRGPAVWYEMRNRVLSLAEINARRRPYFNSTLRFIEPTLQFFVNCHDDAFKVAAETLAARIERFGSGSNAVREWTQAQVDVFANCSEEKLVLPEPPSGRDPLILADYEYQSAAAYFYGMQYEEAATRFRRIGRNKASPWQPYGTYLAARATIRQALVPDHDVSRRDELLTKAEAELREMLRDPVASALHASARGLLDFIGARLHQFERLEALSRVVADAPTVSEQQLIDYRRMMDVFVGDVTAFNYDRVARAERIAGTHELNDWILATQGGGDSGLARALQRWDETRSSLWLVSVLWNLPADHAAASRVLEEAAAVGRSSPAYPTVAFLRVRLLLDLGRRNEARELLASLPRQPERGFEADTINLITAARFRSAESLEELLAYAPRIAVDAKNTRPVFDDDAGLILTKRLPLDLLVQASLSPTLPNRLRVRVASAAFSRAFVFGRRDAGERAARALRDLAPSLRADLDAYLGAPRPEAAHRAAVLLMLRTPGMHAYVRGGMTMSLTIWSTPRGNSITCSAGIGGVRPR